MRIIHIEGAKPPNRRKEVIVSENFNKKEKNQHKKATVDGRQRTS